MFRVAFISICLICSTVSASKPSYEDFKLLASDGASGGRFGYSVSISGDGTTALIGAYGDDDNGYNSGSAYVYHLVKGVLQETKLLASDGASGDWFGVSVSLSGDGTTAIVGASENDDSGSNSGSAYIYELIGGVWQETKLLASDGASDDYFGKSVSLSSDGTTALIGAAFDEDNGASSGSAYIYEFIGGVWQETKLLASDGASGDNFGKSVSLSGDGTTALIGAAFDEDNGASSGSAYIYELIGGVWQETKLLASDGASGDNFGKSVSLSGDGTVALVGAWGDNNNGSFSGSAYIYKRVLGIWQETKLLASDGASDDNFGICVSLSSDGTSALVGTRGDDDNGPASGSAYIYKRVLGIWQETKLLASDGASGDWFGANVSISSNGSTALVGAVYNNHNGINSGSAYIYSLAGGAWQETKLLASDGASNDYFGESVSISSDGTTALVGAVYDDDNGSNSGSAYIYELVDSDSDGVLDGSDNCYLYNPDQADCNGNGIGDVCDIATGWSADANGDGIPDECQCIADITGDKVVNVEDLLAIVGDWGSGGPLGDVNEDGFVDVSDLLIVVGNWGECE